MKERSLTAKVKSASEKLLLKIVRRHRQRNIHYRIDSKLSSYFVMLATSKTSVLTDICRLTIETRVIEQLWRNCDHPIWKNGRRAQSAGNSSYSKGPKGTRQTKCEQTGDGKRMKARLTLPSLLSGKGKKVFYSYSFFSIGRISASLQLTVRSSEESEARATVKSYHLVLCMYTQSKAWAKVPAFVISAWRCIKTR